MKNEFPETLRLSIVCCLFVLLSFTVLAGEPLNHNEFRSPPQSVGVHTWWHWVDGNISKDGITKDLEAMKAQGIVQATILNVGLFDGRDFGVKRVDFGSPEWFGLFQWALNEANRLGISIGAHNCDGWSTSGGPWITPELSMKQFTWTKKIVKGGSKSVIRLMQPQANRDFYRDVAVVAFKTTESENSFQRTAPAVLANDGREIQNVYDGCPVSGFNLKRGDEVTFCFSRTFDAEKIVLVPRRSFMWGDPDQFTSTFSVSVSDDGKNYRKCSDFKLVGLNKSQTVKFSAVSGKYFRLKLENTNRIDDWIPVSLAECEFLKADETALYAPEIDFLSEKTGDIKATREDCYFAATTGSGKASAKKIVDLTSLLKPDGTLDWNPADGNWEIIRFGYTTTGATNAPATAVGLGLECDKMDTAALNLHFRSFPARLIEKAGSFVGNTFKFMLIDSWEAGFQNWTASFPQEFQTRRGYSLIPFIPVLCGESTGSPETDEAVLYDFRKTIGELIETNYYKHFSDLLHQNKLELHAEVIYGNGNYPALDILRTTQYVDLPMFEFWSSTDADLNLSYQPASGVELNMPLCAAIGYQKPVMASEAYTGMAHYSESPAGLRPFGNRAYCSGINQMILHSYVAQPNDNKPGMTLGQFGAHFNRNNTYWPFMSEWLRFQARIQYVLQQGVASQDVLYYLGDQLPQYLEYNASNKLPFGYMMNACNLDILKNRVAVRDGKIILNGTTTYSLLSLPPRPTMAFETLQRIAELVEQGAVVYGPRPTRMLSKSDLTGNRSRFDELVKKLWGEKNGPAAGENQYGKGTVCWGMPVANALKKHGVLPDVVSEVRPGLFDDAENLLFIHKKMGNQEVYFLANQQNEVLRREISFRVSGRTPELWNPEYGTVSYPAVYKTDSMYTSLPVNLNPYESLIFVFTDQMPSEHVVQVRQDGKPIFPSPAVEALTDIPGLEFRNGKLICLSEAKGQIELLTNTQKTIRLVPATMQVFPIQDFSGEIEFEPGYAAAISPVKITRLDWLTESANPDIRYFSGTAKYTISFRFPVQEVVSADSLVLDLGHFGTVARVELNGHELGNLWEAGKLIDVKGLLRENNVLVVSVANTYRNRFIGDFTQFGEVRTLWTSSPITDFLNKDRPLQPSGLKGPIRIIAVSEQAEN